MRRIAVITALIALSSSSAARAADGFITTTFGNQPKCQHGNTLKLAGDLLVFDLSALPKATRVSRAVLTVPAAGHKQGVSVLVAPVGLADAKPLETRPPLHVTFDATAAARAWVADPAANKGLKVVQSAGVAFDKAVLEVSYPGPVAKPAASVTELKALHQSGQTFLTWKEIDDPVGADAPQFVDFEKRVLDARAERNLRYRVYRHDKAITAATLGDADLIAEVQDILTGWNLLQIRNTEHPNQGTPTKGSPLRPGYNLALNHVMTRYQIVDGGEPLPRTSALSVSTTTEPGKRYYAVTVAADGAEAVAKLDPGSSLAEPVDEKVSDFPAAVYLRSSASEGKDGLKVDVYNSWIGPPYNNLPLLSETFVARWNSLPKGDEKNRLPLLVFTSTYGGTATELGSPGWHPSRVHVPGTFRVGVTEGAIWEGFHECIGTLRGYDRGVVQNYPQRRVLGAAKWALARNDFFLDPERVYFWSQLGSWALRNGDLFAAVLSNGYGNPAIGKLAQNWGWAFGPYPKSTKNFAGVDQWEYMDMPKFVRENPTVELPFWVCAPAYGAYPNHTIGDFGFMPWPETIHAMAATKRAFAATWSSNGPGAVGPVQTEQVPRIRLHQSLPAFTNCSLDTSPGDGDHADSEKSGGINIHQRWDTDSIVDEPDKWEMTLYLDSDITCTTDVTPRRCQKFKAAPGTKLRWTLVSADGKELQAGEAAADKWSLVTAENVKLTKDKARIKFEKK